MSDDSVMPRANNAGKCPKGNVTLAMQARAPYARGCRSAPVRDVDLQLLDLHRVQMNEAVQYPVLLTQTAPGIPQIASYLSRANQPTRQNANP